MAEADIASSQPGTVPKIALGHKTRSLNVPAHGRERNASTTSESKSAHTPRILTGILLKVGRDRPWTCKHVGPTNMDSSHPNSYVIGAQYSTPNAHRKSHLAMPHREHDFRLFFSTENGTPNTSTCHAKPATIVGLHTPGRVMEGHVAQQGLLRRGIRSAIASQCAG